jgi:hypothetical protein
MWEDKWIRLCVLWWCLAIASFSPLDAQPGQCTVLPLVTSATCTTTFYSITGTPTSIQFVSNVNSLVTYAASLYTGVASRQPGVGVNAIGLSTSFINQGAPFNSATKELAYLELLDQTGATYWDLNLDPFAFSASSSYAAICAEAGGVCATTNDTSGNLAVYHTIVAYAQAHGIGIRISWSPLSNTWSHFANSGATAPCSSAGISTATPAQIAPCLGPLEATAAVDLHALSPSVTITDETVDHEPTGLFTTALGQTLTTAQWNALTLALIAWVMGQTSVPDSVGSGFTAGDGAYVTAVLADAPLVAVLDFGGLDIYMGKDPSLWNNIWGGSSGYMTWCGEFVTAGMECKVNEAEQVPRWCNSGGSGCPETQAYISCGAQAYDTVGASAAFMTAIARGVAAAGGTYVSIFTTFPLGLFSPTDLNTSSNCSDTASGGYPAYVLNNLPGTITSSGSSWAAATQWNSATLTGPVKLVNTSIK